MILFNLMLISGGTIIPFYLQVSSMKQSKDIRDLVEKLKKLGTNFDATFDWNTSKPLGIHNRCLKLDQKRVSCGTILAHAKEQVSALREKVVIRLCCFKIGVTTNPLIRFRLYLEKGYNQMWVIWTSSSIDIVHMLEAALISEFGRHVGCQNKYGSGGDGALNQEHPQPPPYFVYVVAGRADQPRRVG